LGLSFVALRLDVAGAAADALADALLAAGALSVDVTDPRAGTVLEAPLFDEPGAADFGRWTVSRLTALFPAGADVGRAFDDALRTTGTKAMPCETFVVADQDWVRASEAQFAPIRITETLWIVPSWHAPIDRNAVNVVLDPGLAFGTGSHPTTQLCLRWLDRELRTRESVLDYGCGSGILAIAASLLGAGTVVGVDIDPQAILAARANAAANRAAAVFGSPDELAVTTSKMFDVVVANILANPLLLLAPALAGRVRAGGRIVLSGILESQSDEVAAAFGRWCAVGRTASRLNRCDCLPRETTPWPQCRPRHPTSSRVAPAAGPFSA
jgi:ribosomal protein L11 methyltransferase